MEYEDLLQTIAEVAIAFVGFAGLASIFGRRFSRDEPAVQEERLRGMIHCGLTSVAFSFVPFVVYGTGASADATWRVSSALLGLTYLGLTIAMVRRGRRQGLGLGPHPLLAILVIVFGTGVIGSQLGNTLGLFTDKAPAAYVTGLLLVLATTGMFFTRLLSSLSLAQND